MRLLFDENTPFSLARDLIGHECSHVVRLGWRGAKNGALLDRAERAGFDVLLTLDDDMRPEQNMSRRKIAIIVIKPAKQGKAALKSMGGRVLLSLASIQAGDIRIVDHGDET